MYQFFRDCHPQGLKNYHVLYIIIMVFRNPTAPYVAAIFNKFIEADLTDFGNWSDLAHQLCYSTPH